jgi:branched-chain amino acid transport system substrate-binding protein
MMGQRPTAGAVIAALVAALAVTACGSSNSSGGSSGGASTSGSAKKPLTIGISLSASGDFSDPGNAAKRGYELWADTVNAKGGILGRKVKLKIVDDASSPNQVVTNYQNLITRDKVDLVFGPFSTLLTAPAAKVVDRYRYAFPEPAGGGPAVFAEKLNNVFFVQPSPVIDCGDPFVNWLKTLPADQRPKTAAYPTLDDPFAAPIVARTRTMLEAMGVKTVFSQIYPSETQDLTPIVQKYVAAKPDLVFAGTQSEDAYSQVKALIQANYNPKYLFFANGANSPVEFPDKVGAKNTEGIFSCSAWFPTSKTPGNADFVSAYLKKYGGTPDQIDSGSAESYAVGQLIEDVAKKTGRIDNQTIMAALHKGQWPTVQGNLSWDANGAPTGSQLLSEWVGGKLLPVFPAALAQHAPQAPKPAWAG